MNYDKGHLEEDAGINYALEEYANAVVFTVKEVCDANEVPTPTLVTESGRALTAHHSVLIVPVLGAHAQGRPDAGPHGAAKNVAEPLHALEQDPRGAAEDAASKSELLEALPRRQRDGSRKCDSCSRSAICRSSERALAESLYWRICTALLKALKRSPETSRPEIVELEDKLTRALSLRLLRVPVDARPLGHRPAVPDRADRPARRARPTKRAVLVDLTCDSDGKVTHYVSTRDNRFLPVHPTVQRHAVLPRLLPRWAPTRTSSATRTICSAA